MQFTPRKIMQLSVIGIVALFALITLCSSFYTVPSGSKAIVFRFGQVQEVTSDGLHLKTPFIEQNTTVDVRTQKAHSPASAGTKDLQTVTTEVALNWHLNGALLQDTYTRFGLDVEDKVIEPRIQEIVKAVIARFSAEELLTKRDAVKQEIASGLRNTLAQYNIVVEDIQITNFSFSKAFDNAIESKQTAEQNALKAKNDLDRIKVEAEQKITMAQAEAETIRIQASAIKEQGGEEYVKMKAIEKWNGILPQYTGGGTMPFISIPQK